MAKSEQVIKDLDRVIGLINTDMKDIPAEEKKQMVADTIDHFNRSPFLFVFDLSGRHRLKNIKKPYVSL